MKSWEDCYHDPFGFIYVKGELEAASAESRFTVRYMVMRGKYSLVAYVGVPEDHPSAGWGIHYDIPLDVHGGVTFSGSGDDDLRPKGWWWYGWDYGHAFDRTWIDLAMRDKGQPFPPSSFPEHEWDMAEVAVEAHDAAEQMLALVRRNWQPTPEERGEATEREKQAEVFRAGLETGEVGKEAERSLAKLRRMRELDG